MAHPTLPQLVHVPAEGPAAGTEVLQSRPAGGASQSAAEATLGLVTVDILGLAGTGVPSAGVELLDRGIVLASNVVSHSFTTTRHGSATGVLIGTTGIAGPTFEPSLGFSSVTVNGAPLTKLGATWWWGPLVPAPGQLTIVATAQATAIQMGVTHVQLTGAGTPTVVVRREAGGGTRYWVDIAAPAGALVLDQGRMLPRDPVMPGATPDSGQVVDYQTPPPAVGVRYWFGSHRPVAAAATVTMGWTGPDAYFEVSAITMPPGG
jgi:hypothetical protein